MKGVERRRNEMKDEKDVISWKEKE